MSERATDTLREVVGKAMLARFEESYRKHNVSYDPDTVWEAADDVVAALAGALLDQRVSVLRTPGIIGTIGFQTKAPQL